MSKIVVKKTLNYHYYRVFFALRVIAVLLFGLYVPACGGHVYHVVEPGETLYSIGWLYGHDYRQIAKWNKIEKPYVIFRGQRLRVASMGQEKKSINAVSTNMKSVTIETKGLNRTAVKSKEKQHSTPDKYTNNKKSKTVKWSWPTRGGTIIHSFDRSNPSKKGLDLAGKTGQAVYTASPGKVVYSGNGISRYGKLIIVKHNETYLSAYAHNRRLLVKEGDILRSRQQIAEMGSSGASRIKLHFEIRRNGKPVDPLRYLPKKKP